jgi:hypothetical protein
MFRAELPRHYELKDRIADPTSPDAYFLDFDQNLARYSEAKDFYLRQERALQRLDDKAWEHLKGEALPYLTACDKKGRGWTQLFDILNEAKAYNYLKSRGCTNLRFIPRAHKKTPDLEGSHALDRVLCEVKTINASNEEIDFRTGRKKIRSGQITLPAEFFGKLHSKIEDAKQQLSAFNCDHASIHFVYLYIWFDDVEAQFKEAYFKQIDDDLATPQTDFTLVICNDYTAFYKPLQMRFADVDNIE